MYLMQPYDDALEQILKHGIRKTNRTGVDTLAVNGIQCHYDISTHYPLLTKRKVWPKSVIAELLWFLSGSTSNDDLVKLGCNFWTPWVSEEFEKKHEFEPGFFGPVYGWQLRHFGASYKQYQTNLRFNRSLHPNDDNWANEMALALLDNGFDQLEWMENELRNNPTSRRILFSLWNPKDFSIMRLPPCHYTYQVIVDGHDRISGILTQRSCDFPIGVPANIQFYSTLTLMFAKCFGFQPYEFIHNTNDSHIYVNQIESVEEYLSRPQIDSPTIEFCCQPSTTRYKPEDFTIQNYNPLDPIKIPVTV